MENIKLKIKYILLGSVGVFLLFALDQWTKRLAEKHLANEQAIWLIKGVLQLQYLENQGAAFGLMQNKIGIFIFLTTIFLIAAVCVYLILPKTKRFLPLHIITVVLFAGAVGNFIDRIRMGYVIDFIYFSLIDFPIFNVADIYVTLSGIALFIVVVFYYKDEDFAQFSLKKKEEN